MMLLVCSGNEAVRKKWSATLAEKYIVRQAASFAEIVRLFGSLPVDLLLVHRSLVDEKQLGELCGLRPGKKIFIFSDRPSDEEGTACLKAGCVGYANTYISRARLTMAIETVGSGLAWVGKSLIEHIVRNMASAEKAEEVPAAGNRVTKDLSPREREIAHLVSAGLQNQAIAGRLGITERTVKAHLGAIYAKTGTNNRLALALRVNRSG